MCNQLTTASTTFTGCPHTTCNTANKFCLDTTSYGDPTSSQLNPQDTVDAEIKFYSPTPATTTDDLFSATLVYRIKDPNGVITTKSLPLTATRPHAGSSYKITAIDNGVSTVVYDSAAGTTNTPSFNCGTFMYGACTTKSITMKVDNSGTNALYFNSVAFVGSAPYFSVIGYTPPATAISSVSFPISCYCPTSSNSGTINASSTLRFTLNSVAKDVVLSSTFQSPVVTTGTVGLGGGTATTNYAVTVDNQPAPFVFPTIATNTTPVAATFRIVNTGTTALTLGAVSTGTSTTFSIVCPTATSIVAGTTYSCTVTAKDSSNGSDSTAGSILYTINGTQNTFGIAAYHDPLCPAGYWSSSGYTTGIGGCAACTTQIYTSTDPCTFMTLNTSCYVNVGGCFKKGTKILTPSGEKNIEEIKKGDIVYSYDLKSKKLVENTVVKPVAHKNFKDPAVVLSLSDGTKVDVTTNHPFYSPKHKQFKFLRDLKVGDKVLLYKDSFKEVAIESIVKQDFFDVEYNLHLKNKQHNYFANGILVHNAVGTGDDGTVTHK